VTLLFALWPFGNSLNESVSYTGPLSEGKQRFLASAAKEFEDAHGSKITGESTLLIDDDAHNIGIALNAGVRGLLFLPDEPEM
jgi:hypothetical protein